MDFLIEEVLKELRKINDVKLTPKEKNKIYNNFPVPKEQKILWTGSMEDNKKYGMVVTDVGIFFKTP